MANPLDSGGNVKVDFVWGNMPMQPDDQRGMATLDPELDNHIIATSGYEGFPAFIPGAPYDDTIPNATVPNIVGLTRAAAETAISNAGLIANGPTTTITGATTTNDGKVKTQSPAAGIVVNTGTEVDFVLYLAATVPNLAGQDEAGATQMLLDSNLVLGTVTTSTDGATVENDGTVKSQTPAPSAKANTGSAVDIVLYLAPTVPDVLGLDETAAGAALVSAGLIKGTVTTSADGATAENDGLVKSQTPVSGGKADTGSAVDLVLYEYTAP